MPRKMFCLSTVLLFILLSFFVFSSFTAHVYATEETIQEKGLAILSEVVGLDLEKYEITMVNHSTPIFVSDQNVDYRLASNTSNLRIVFTFTDGNFEMLHVVTNYGSPFLVKPTSNTSSLVMVRTILSNYQNYTSNPLFGELKSTLDTVKDNENATITSGNTILEITHSAHFKRSTYKWTYTASGAIAPNKFLAISFENNFLEFLVDKMSASPVKTTTINLSEEEAIEIALETAANHSWSLTLDDDAFEPQNFNTSNVRWTSLIFKDSAGATNPREDPSALYPVWCIGVALNRWYGSLYGIVVEIWADTKEVRATQEAWSMMEPDIIPEFPSWTPIHITLVAIVAVAVIYRLRPNKQNRRRDNQ